MLQFTVIGVAEQQGSMRAFVPRGRSRPIITDSNKNLRGWRQLVSESAHRAILQLPEAERAPLRDGVRLTIAFYLPRPKSLSAKVTAHTKRPDLDKFVRAVTDALTQIAFGDDSQVCDLVAMKRYAAEGTTPRAEIWVESTAGVAALARKQAVFAQPQLFTGSEA